MLPDLKEGFSRGRSGGLVFPSLEEFSTVIVIHTVKGFGIVNKAEIDAFLELSCFFDDPADVGNLILEAGIKIAGRNINNLRYADDTTLMAESEEELKSLLMKVKQDNEKVGLKLNIHKTKIMASGPITSWQIEGETMETVRDLIFLGTKITVDDDCSNKLKDACSLEEKL